MFTGSFIDLKPGAVGNVSATIDTRLRAVLARSFRVDRKPVQRHIAYLGSTSIDGSDRPRFWYQVYTKLDRLGDRLSPADRRKILAIITKKLGEQPPTKAELAAFVPSGFLMYHPPPAARTEKATPAPASWPRLAIGAKRKDA
jgi:hypothetical protein